MLQSTSKSLIVLIFIFLHQSLIASDWGKPKETEDKLFNVQVVESLATVINDSIDFSSTTEASRKIEIKSEVMTTVDQVMIKAGTLIKKGQHVIKLNDFDTNKELFDIDLLSLNEFNKVALFAPFTGILLDGHKIGGELVMPGEKVYELIDLSTLKIFGYINENEILNITLDNKVKISILGENIEGKIDYISPISDPNTKTFEIVVKVDNKNYRFKDGLSSMISIKKGEVLVHKISPSILALGDDGALGVKVINNESEVLFKEIQVIEDTSEYMLVTGLDEKEKIIIVGQQYVSNGEEVSF